MFWEITGEAPKPTGCGGVSDGCQGFPEEVNCKQSPERWRMRGWGKGQPWQRTNSTYKGHVLDEHEDRFVRGRGCREQGLMRKGVGSAVGTLSSGQ